MTTVNFCKSVVLFLFGAYFLYRGLFKRIYFFAYLDTGKAIDIQFKAFSYLSIAWFIIFASITIISLILLLNKLFFKRDNKFTYLLNVITKTITSFIYNAIYYFYDTVLSSLRGIIKGNLLWKFLENSSHFFINLKPYYVYINILFLKLPVYITACCLFTDVCLNQQYYYIFKIIPIMLIYTIFRVWISMVKCFGFDNQTALAYLVNYEIYTEDDQEQLKYIKIRDGMVLPKDLSEEYCKQLLFLCFNVQKAYIQLMESTNIKIFDWLSLTVYLMYFSVWITMFYQIFK